MTTFLPHVITVLDDDGNYITGTYTCPTNGADNSPCSRGWTLTGGHRCSVAWVLDRQDIALGIDELYTVANDRLLDLMHVAAGMSEYEMHAPLPAGRYVFDVVGVTCDLRPEIEGQVLFEPIPHGSGLNLAPRG